MKVVHLVIVLPYVLRAMSASVDVLAVDVFGSENDPNPGTATSTSGSNGETALAGFR